MASAIDMMFGANFSMILDVTFGKLTEHDVQVDRETFDGCVNEAVFEFMTKQVELMRQTQANPTVPKPRVEKSKTAKPKIATSEIETCKYVLTRGDSKGNACGKPVKAGASGCAAHVSKLKSDAAPAEASDAVKSDAVKSDVVKPSKCTFVITKGDRAGTECGATAKVGDKCTTHSKAKAPTEKKNTIPIPRDTSLIPQQATDTIKLIYNNERDILFDPVSGFVLKSKDERVVVGHVNVDSTRRLAVPVGDVRDLTSEQIEQIKTAGRFDLDPKYNKVAPVEVKKLAKPDASEISDIEDVLNAVEKSGDEDEDDFFDDED